MAQNREEQLKEISERLEQGVKEYFTDENYVTYLNTMAKFHNYSFNNTLLIAMQKPEATLVAGYQAWQKKFERHVKKGEKGIQIIAPAPVKQKEEIEKIDPVTNEPVLKENGQPEIEMVEMVIPRFRVTTVFDVSQTEGKSLPEWDINDLIADVAHYEDYIQAIIAVSPVPVRYDEIDGEAHGYYHQVSKEIVIQNGMSESQTMKTAIHEVAHAKLHDKEIMEEQGVKKDKLTREVEAESTAYVVCQYFGLDTSDYSFPYIASWSSGRDMKELKDSMDTVRRTAGEMIHDISEQIKELQQEHEEETDLSAMEFASQLIDQVEYNGTIFNDDERNLIMNYAFKLDDKKAVQTLIEELKEALEDPDMQGSRRARSAARAEIDSFPDSMIGMSEMHQYGYWYNGILPLQKEKAEELFERGYHIYALYPDGTESEILEPVEMETHDGLYGVGKERWEKHLDDLEKLKTEKFQEVDIFEIPALYSNGRIDDDVLPEGVYRYDLRGSDYDPNMPVTMEKNVFVNHASTILTTAEIPLPEKGYIHLGEEINFTGGVLTIAEYQKNMERFPLEAWKEAMYNAMGRADEGILLSGNENRYAIYQLNHDGVGRDKAFWGMDYLKEKGLSVDASEYELVYNGRLKETDTLDSLYEKFNLHHPEDFRGHSLSVSDVVVLLQDGKVTGYFVDRFGFTEVPEFVIQREAVHQRNLLIEMNQIVTEATEGLEVEQHSGTWHTAEVKEINGEKFFRMEHDEFGSAVAGVIVNETGELVAQEVENGFDREVMDIIGEYFKERGIEFSSENDLENAVVSTGAEPNYPPVYYQSLIYATGNKEADVYLDSRKLNLNCKKEIEDAITDHFDGMHLEHDAAVPVLDKYGAERVTFVLANTLQKLSYDGRFSRSNKEWADSFSIPENIGRGMVDLNADYIVQSHPAVLDGFVDLVRVAVREREKEKTVILEQSKEQGMDEVKNAWLKNMDEALAFQIGEKYFSIQTVADGYDYTFYDEKFHELDGGVYDNPDISIKEAMKEILEDERISTEDCVAVDFDELQENVESVGQAEIEAVQTAETELSLTSEDKEVRTSLNGQSKAEIEETVLCFAQAEIDEMGLTDEVQLLGARVIGSRTRDSLYRVDSDIDVVLSYSGNIREDALFNALHESEMSIAGMVLDVNPISVEQTATLSEYLESAEKYLDEKEAEMAETGISNERAAQAKNVISEEDIFHTENEKYEATISFFFAECREFPVLGEFHEDITLEEAVDYYNKIPSERLSGIKSIGFNLQDGSDYEGNFDLFAGGEILYQDLEDVPYYKESPLVQKAISDLEGMVERGEIYNAMPLHKEEIEQTQTIWQEQPIKAEPGTGKRESVLKALRERQAKIKEQEKAKEKSQDKLHAKKKGDMEL